MYEQYPDEFYNLVDQFVATGRYGGRPEAAEAVRRARPDLRPTGVNTTPATVRGSAEERLVALLKRVAGEKRIPFAQAYIEALTSNTELYAAYLREHAAGVHMCRRR
jgi:hypothetical protein